MKTIKSGNKIIGIIFEDDIVMSDTVSGDYAAHIGAPEENIPLSVAEYIESVLESNSQYDRFGEITLDDMPTDLSLKDMAKHLIKILVDNMQPDPEVLAEAVWDLFMPVPFPSLEEMDYPRTCSHCGNGMYEGYCIDAGLEYYCSDECLHKHYTEEEYLELYDDGNGDSYWTEWEDEEREDLIYEYETKIAKAKRNNDTEAQYYYQDKLDELLREDDLTGSLTNKKEG